MKKGFTLAEMLIVMIVIGIIAMLTIPTVVRVNKDRAISDMLNEIYNKIELALVIDKIMDFDVSNYQISSINKKYSAKDFSELLKKKLKIISYCGDEREGCFKSDIIKGYSLRLISGGGILVNEDFRNERDPVDNTNIIIGSTYIDVDGPLGVNKPGKDQFGFYTTYKGLIPMGGPHDKIVPFSHCLEKGNFACSAWVLINKNMDYKECPKQLNWENKLTCD